MESLLAVALAVLAGAAASPTVSPNKECNPDKCPNYAMLRYYKELTCHPHNNSDACCPAAFDCSFLDAIDNKKCQYKGIAYDVGSILYDEVEDPCAAECRCTETLWGTGFECTGVVCPEAEVYGQLRPNCFLKFDATHCCATGFYCLPDGNEEGLETEPTMKCIYNGYEHVEGQYLSVDYPLCLVCVCEKGFDEGTAALYISAVRWYICNDDSSVRSTPLPSDSLQWWQNVCSRNISRRRYLVTGTLNGPWCHKFTCDMMVRFKVPHIKYCAPVFSNELSCCPLQLHCPVGSDYVLQVSNVTRTTDMHCSFGLLRLRQGDILVSPGICVRCRCDVPPFVTCYMYRYEGCKFPKPGMYGG